MPEGEPTQEEGGAVARLSQVFVPKDREFFDLFEEAAALFAVLAVLAFLAFAGAVALGLFIITDK